MTGGAASFSSSITAQSGLFAQDILADPVYLRVRNLNTGGYPSSMSFSLYGYNTSAYYDVLRIQASYPGYGLANFIVKNQSNSSDVIAFSIKGTGEAVFTANNVGIGQFSPTVLLDLKKSAGAAYGTLTDMINLNGYFTGYDVDAQRAGIQAGVPNYGNTTYGQIGFATRGEDGYLTRMIIYPDGNVGIGTSKTDTLGYKLRVQGQGYFTSNLTGGSIIKIGGTSSQFLMADGSVNGTTYQPQINGTGFVKASGTTISYDNSTYLTTSSATSTYVPYSGANASVNLGASYSMTASSFFESSDIRFKDVLETNPSISALGIDVIKFTRKGQSQVRYGYSAQQVQSILPDAVFGDNELTVNYSDVHTIKIASLEKRVAELESRLKSTI